MPPLTPEEEARVNAYWNVPVPGAPAVPSVSGAMPVADPSQLASMAQSFAAQDQAAGAAQQASMAGSHAAPMQRIGADTSVQSFRQLAAKPMAQIMAENAPKAPPPAPVSPTANEDAELAALVRDMQAKKQAPAVGGGAKAPSNPDPYGIRGAQEGQLGALGDRSDALRRAADASAVRAVQVADGQRDLSRLQGEDAAIARAEGEYAQRHFDEGMQEVARELDDVRSKKIDPLRTMKEQPALAVLAVIGGALGGFYQGITGGQENQFLKDLDHQIDRGIVEDERQIREKKFGAVEAGNLLQQARASHKDDQLAQMQYRNMSYEAAKQAIAAEASRDDVMVDKAKADELIAQINFSQQELAEKIGLRRQSLAQSAAAGAYAHAKEVRDYRAKVYEKMLSEGYSPAQAEEESRRQVAVQYLPGTAGARPAGDRGNTMPLGKTARDEIEKETHKARTEVGGLIDTFKSYDPKKVAAGGSVAAQLPNVLRTENMRSEADERERYNSDVRASVGAAWRLKTHGMEPKNPTLLEEQAHAFLAVPTDGPADIQRKRANMIEHLTNAARSSGVDAPPSGRSQADALGARPVK